MDPVNSTSPELTEELAPITPPLEAAAASAPEVVIPLPSDDALAIMLQDVNKNTLFNCVTLLDLFAKYCASENITSIDLSKLSLHRSITYTKVFILREIITSRIEFRGPRFSIENYGRALCNLFEVKQENFSALVKELLPTDSSEKSQLLKKMAFFVSRAQECSLHCDWLIPEQVQQVYEITTSQDDVKIRNRRIYSYAEAAEEHLPARAILDHDLFGNLSCELMIDLFDHIDPVLETIEQEILSEVEKLKSFTNIQKKGRSSRKVPAPIKELSTFCTYSLPTEVLTSLEKMNAARKRIKKLISHATGKTLSQVRPILLETHKLILECIENSTLLVRPVRALLCALSPTSDTHEILAAHRETTLKELSKTYNNSIPVIINDTLSEIIHERARSGQQLSNQELKEIHESILGTLILELEDPDTKDTLFDSYIQLAKSPILGKHRAKVQKKIRSLLNLFQTTYINCQTSNHQQLEGLFSLTRIEDVRFLIYGLFSEDLSIKRYESSLNISLTCVDSAREHRTAENLTRTLSDTSTQFTNSLTNLPPFQTSQKKLIETYLETMKGILNLTNSVLGGEHVNIDQITRSVLSLVNKTRLYKDLAPSSCSTLSLLLNPIIQVVDNVDFSTLPEEVHQFELEEAELKEAVARIAERELLMQIEEEERQKADASTEREEEPIQFEVQKEIPDSVAASEAAEIIVTSSSEDPKAAATALTTSPFPCIRPISPKVLLGIAKLNPQAICDTHSQIYFHQTLTIIATLLKHPELSPALVPSLLESMHLALEQQATSYGIENGVARVEDFNAHQLSIRFRECGLAPLCPDVRKVTEVGTYCARYPSVIRHQIRGPSLTAKILQEMQSTGTLSEALLFDAANQVNLLISSVKSVSAPTSLSKEDLKVFSHDDAPLKMPNLNPPIAAVITGIHRNFPANSDTKTDIMQHLTELDHIINMINRDQGLRKEVSGVTLHALFRIRQYTIRNLLTLIYLRDVGPLQGIPSKVKDIGGILNLDLELIEILDNTQMGKRLDYPLGGRERTKQRSLTESERTLMQAHYQSLAPAGFSMPKEVSEERILTLTKDTIDEIVNLLRAILVV